MRGARVTPWVVGLLFSANGCVCSTVGPVQGTDSAFDPGTTDSGAGAGGGGGGGDVTTDATAPGTDAAPPAQLCGNGTCDAGETSDNCPPDCATPPPPPPPAGSCGSVCGDGVCTDGEYCGTCPADCGTCDYSSPTACECSSYGGLDACCNGGGCDADCPGSGACDGAALAASGKLDCTGASSCTALLSGGCAWVDCTGVADCTASCIDCYGNPMPVSPCPTGPGFVCGDCTSATVCTFTLGAACVF